MSSDQHPYRGLAIVLSFILPGLGQIYNQEFGKGASFILSWMVSWTLTSVVLGWPLLIAVWIWSMVDAYQFAERTDLSEPENEKN